MYGLILHLYLLLPLLLTLEVISIHHQFFLHFFQYLISLTSFEDHSPHLHVELVVNLSLHFFVHKFHELLDNIFDVLEIGAFVKLILKGLVDAHHVRRFAEGYIAAVARAGLLFCGDYFEDV